MVTQFVGFLGGWNHPGQLPPLLAATVAALVTRWTTFTPCFLWNFLGGPYIERLRGNLALTTTLSAVTAAVVGVVLNLAVWFGLHVIFPSPGTVDWFAILVGLVAFTGMVRWKWDIARWTGRLVAGALGNVSDDAVWRVMRKHDLHLDRRQSWCVSTDPEFYRPVTKQEGRMRIWGEHRECFRDDQIYLYRCYLRWK